MTPSKEIMISLPSSKYHLCSSEITIALLHVKHVNDNIDNKMLLVNDNEQFDHFFHNACFNYSAPVA